MPRDSCSVLDHVILFTEPERFWNDFHSCLLKCVWREAYKPIWTCGIFPETVYKLEDSCGDNGFGCVQKQMYCVIWSRLKDGPSVGWRWGRLSADLDTPAEHGSTPIGLSLGAALESTRFVRQWQPSRIKRSGYRIWQFNVYSCCSYCEES